MYSSREVVDPDMKNGNSLLKYEIRFSADTIFHNKMQKCVQLTHLPYVGLK